LWRFQLQHRQCPHFVFFFNFHAFFFIFCVYTTGTRTYIQLSRAIDDTSSCESSNSSCQRKEKIIEVIDCDNDFIFIVWWHQKLFAYSTYIYIYIYMCVHIDMMINFCKTSQIIITLYPLYPEAITDKACIPLVSIIRVEWGSTCYLNNNKNKYYKNKIISCTNRPHLQWKCTTRIFSQFLIL
jgi:hypothetical protein